MKIKELLRFIDGIAPFDTQADWDNSGLLIGDPDAEITGAVVCLDVTADAVALALKTGANAIVSHHPVIFHAVKSLTAGSAAYEAAKNGMNVICAHTCFDKAPGGVNDVLCEKLGFAYEKCPDSVAEGFLNVVYPDAPTDAASLARRAADCLGAAVRYSDSGRPVTKIAVCAGAGDDLYPVAAALGCEALITGDAGHHRFLDAAAMGVSIVAAGHFETENPAAEKLARVIREAFPSLSVEFCGTLGAVETVLPGDV